MVENCLSCYFYGLLASIPFLFALYIVRALKSYFGAASGFNGD